jgi:hypothetical protein
MLNQGYFKPNYSLSGTKACLLKLGSIPVYWRTLYIQKNRSDIITMKCNKCFNEAISQKHEILKKYYTNAFEVIQEV